MKPFLGELLGTFILVLVGTGSVAVATLIYPLELYQVALIWVVGVSGAIYASRNLSGAHLNPAVSVGLKIAGTKFNLLSYLIAQFIGAMIAGITIYMAFSESIGSYELEHEIVRGGFGSYKSACMFGEYFPNPGFASLEVSTFFATIVEGVGTMILMAVILLISNKRPRSLQPLFIGITVGNLIFFLAPYTQAGFNPARDLGPKTLSFFLGWKWQAFDQGVFNHILVYGIAPLLGASIAGIGFKSASNS